MHPPAQSEPDVGTILSKAFVYTCLKATEGEKARQKECAAYIDL